jgi:hypothetical protein
MERTTKVESFGTQLCQVLKLNPAKIKTITIKVQAEKVTVTTEEILLVDEAKDVLKMLQYYHLVETINGKPK